MEHQEQFHFNEAMRQRCFEMSIQVYELVKDKRVNYVTRSIIGQVIRSSSSVTANFRAATRARSNGEFYAKICIVVEECDETQYWLEYLLRIGLVKDPEISGLNNEICQLLSIFTSMKKKMKTKLTTK